MERTIRVSLNKFPTVPESLRVDPQTDVALDEIVVNLGDLYHHYFWDCYGSDPPNPDPAQFEYLQFLAATKDFLLRGDGIGVNVGTRRNSSMALGQAFCRWFLHDHLGIVYFAHVSEIIGRQLMAPFDGFSLVRKSAGDTPDYLCASASRDPYLAEAKGRYTAINFNNKEFDVWRQQFERVECRDASGVLAALKGYIVATRFGAEQGRSNARTTLFAEDPQSPGERPLDERGRRQLGASVIAVHYARVAERLGQPILAAALRTGFQVPEEIRINAIAWELQFPPLERTRFIGGYFPSREGTRPIQLSSGKFEFVRDDLLRLGVGNGTFLGVKETIFQQMVGTARRVSVGGDLIEPLPQSLPFYSAISLLRDGSVVGPIDFFRPVQGITL